MSKKVSVKKGQIVAGYNSYGELCGGRVTAVSEDSVTVGGMISTSIHLEDAVVIEVPESDTIESRLKQHVVEHRQREKAAAAKAPKGK